MSEALHELPTLIEEEFVEEVYEYPSADHNSKEVVSSQQSLDKLNKPTSELPQSRPNDEL